MEPYYCVQPIGHKFTGFHCKKMSQRLVCIGYLTSVVLPSFFSLQKTVNRFKLSK